LKPVNRGAILFILILIGTASTLTLSFGGWGVTGVLGQETQPTPQPGETLGGEQDPNLSISDEVCLECHGQPGSTMELANGELVELYVPAEAHINSVHGELGYACVQCHTDVGEYPHPEFVADDQRDLTLKLNSTCQRCHQSQYELAKDSVHAVALEEGNREAAVCTDCHTAHEVRRLIDPETGEILPEARTWIPQTCARCHSEIYDKYQESVHGSALIGEGNPEVPTCIDCHGVHNIEDPTTAQFRLNSPQMCADCHTDPEIMDKYGISTDVLDTYVADFHGTSIVLFEQNTPDADINKPVCFDCHGVHDIARADDPQKGLQVKQNILGRCRLCHPDADENFPDSWMSHYIPSPDKNPLVYYVDLFYKIIIPVIVGGMGVLVVMDASRMVLNRRRLRKATEESDDSNGDRPSSPESEDSHKDVDAVQPDELNEGNPEAENG
jgi:hypothetical protein